MPKKKKWAPKVRINMCLIKNYLIAHLGNPLETLNPFNKSYGMEEVVALDYPIILCSQNINFIISDISSSGIWRV